MNGGKGDDSRLDDDHVLIVVFIIKSDTAVAPLNFTHGYFLPCLMVSGRSDRLGLCCTQAVDPSLNFEPLLP